MKVCLLLAALASTLKDMKVRFLFYYQRKSFKYEDYIFLFTQFNLWEHNFQPVMRAIIQLKCLENTKQLNPPFNAVHLEMVKKKKTTPQPLGYCGLWPPFFAQFIEQRYRPRLGRCAGSDQFSVQIGNQLQHIKQHASVQMGVWSFLFNTTANTLSAHGQSAAAKVRLLYLLFPCQGSV